MPGGTRFSGDERPSPEQRRVLSLLRRAREVVPGYGRGPPIGRPAIRRLASFCRLRVDRAVLEMDAPAVLLPPLEGRHRLILSSGVAPALADYITLHEIGHVLAGDADELTFLRWAGPLPEAEDVADLFALCGILDEVHCRQGPGWVERRIRGRVLLDDCGWRRHRVPRLARKLCRLRRVVTVDRPDPPVPPR